jgi:EAL domain-containing protein (putative c-di-GMP-specific phosphodiesterase class I)
MKEQQGLYQSLKSWISKQMKVEQPQINIAQFETQSIHLEPIFDCQNQVFIGAICNDLIETNSTIYLKHFKKSLEEIAYWHCHGRAILTLLPLTISFAKDKGFIEQYETYLLQSQLPVGLIRIPIIGYKNDEVDLYYDFLNQLQRLGLILELKNFSNSQTELAWLHTQMFKGVHLSTHLVRAAMTTSFSKELFNDLLITCRDKNYHTYGEGISLVHDFNFAKNNQVKFCYGPLMMPCVSKHQLLKIQTSQFHGSFNVSPKKNTKNGS